MSKEMTAAQAISNVARDLSWTTAIDMCNEMVACGDAKDEQDWEKGETRFDFEDGTSIIFSSDACDIAQ